MSGVWDFHVRLGPRPGAAESLLAAMTAQRIDGAVVVAGGVVAPQQLSRQLIDGGYVTHAPDNDAVLAAARASDGRLLPAYFGNPHHSPTAYLRRCADFVGLELSPAVHGIPISDRRFRDWTAAAEGAGHWVYVVALDRAGCTVADVVDLARSQPGLTVVLGHLGVGNIDYYAIDMVAGEPNILVESSGGYSSVLRHALAALGPMRVLFGTEYPLQDPAVELAKVSVLDLPSAAQEAVLSGNALRLLGRAA